MKPGLDLEHVNTSIKATTDLFRHVNGLWIDSTEIPSDKAVYGSFHMLADDSELAVRGILEEAAKSPSQGVSQQIGDLFGSFMDEEMANRLGAQPISQDLKEIAALTNLDDATELMSKLEKYGVSGLFGTYVNNDPGNPERYLAHLYHGGLGLPDEDYYKNEKYEAIRNAYIPFIAKLLKLAGWSDTESQAAASKIYEFEEKLSKVHWNVVDSRDADKTYNLKTQEELQKMTPTFSWQRYLKGAGVKENFLAENVTMMPSFFEGIETVYNQENLEVIKLWLALQLIRSYAPYLSQDFVDERFEFYGKTLTGQPENRPRWKRAVSLVEGSLGEAIGQIYVEKYFQPSAKKRMDDLVKYLIEAYRQSISNLEWMTEETKKKALEKLSKFTPKIGYPIKWKDYSSIKIDRNDLIGNVKRVSEWEHNYHAAKIGAPIDRDEWHMTPQTVNAYYNPGFNEIVFPAAILQPPFFSEQADDAVNFGAIGAVIGHEIGHGFDDQGSKYDGDGKLESWWTEADRKAFEERTGSLIAQYSQLTPNQLEEKYKVNGELTIGENIGDLGGLGIAWKAYLISLHGETPKEIDGISAAKRFLFSWAQAWRTKSRDEIMIQRLATDPHSPAEFRCNQVVRNLDLFHEAFGTTSDDELWLDPKARVEIW